ncbi:DUF4344 domain-containing metallopeptidase [Mycolicibacterium litorale]|uniref:DUF4344 domain-containing metallopeptidase n=1 Tax=Mycolicibacterium litorale TaxID=758802 RepID=UPI003CFB2EC2
MTVVRLSAAACALLLAAGCSEKSQGAAEVEPSPSDAAAAESGVEPDAPGEMTVVYEDATTPEAVNGRRILTDSGLLEALAADVNESLVLPEDVRLVGAQCDEANAFWTSDERTVTICYEDTDLSHTTFEQSGDPDPLAATLGAERATFYHELGHATLDLYDLPFTGREEDVADQLAAVLLLEPDEGGTIDPADVGAAVAYARMFEANSEQDGGAAEDFPFWDVHEYDLARMYNFQCWIYGADPQGNAFIVDQGLVPEDRADSCEGEFDRMSRAWWDMLDPHLRDS